MTKRFPLCFLLCALLFPLQRTWSEDPDPVPEIGTPQEPVSLSDPLLQEARQALDSGHWRDARKKVNKFLNSNSTSAEGWTLLARTYQAAGGYKKAKKRYGKALKFDPHYAPAYVGRGEIFEKMGKLDEAANDFRAATLSDPNSLEARQALARLFPE
jgi:Tfp pilus assembly protein PilF